MCIYVHTYTHTYTPNHKTQNVFATRACIPTAHVRASHAMTWQPFFVPRSCMLMSLTQSGSQFQGVELSKIKAIPKEIQPNGS